MTLYFQRLLADEPSAVFHIFHFERESTQPMFGVRVRDICMVVMSLKKKQTIIDSYSALSCHWQAATCPNAGINPSWQRDCTSRSSGDVQKMKERFVLSRCNRYGVATDNANVSFFL